MTARSGILLTAFEPSGDALAAALIAELKRREPERAIHAMGGPKMRQAGAELIESTTDHAAMGIGAAKHALEHRRRLKRLRRWMQAHAPAAVIPTDSPAANWAVCAITRKLHPQAKIIHLAAPQLWAWASWRIRRMRRLSDHVLCLLPFETEWFVSRGVAATFVGHPLFDAGREDASDRACLFATPVSGRQDTSVAEVKLAVLPGSRASEVSGNLPTMIEAIDRLHARGAMLTTVIAASDPARQRQARELSAGRFDIAVGRTDQLLAWADVVLVVSGTATLQVAARRKPMVILYNANPLMWHGVGRWLVSTRTFTLPNLIGADLGFDRVVPELVPHFGAVEPVVEALKPLLTEGMARSRQRELFDAIGRAYEDVDFATAAANAVQRVMGESGGS